MRTTPPTPSRGEQASLSDGKHLDRRLTARGETVGARVGLQGSAAGRSVQQRPDRSPDPASQRPTTPCPPATASRRPSGAYSVANAGVG